MGQVIDTFAPMIEGFGKDKAARFEAKQMEQQSKAIKAQGGRQATSVRRQTKGILGDMKAMQAGQGGSSSDTSSIRASAKMKDRGEFNALATIFGANEQAAGRKNQANAKRFEGRVARNSGIMKSASNFMAGGSSSTDSAKNMGKSFTAFFGG